MYIFSQLITSFIATAAFGILFNIPKNALVKCGLIGMGGWIIYFASQEHSGPVIATFNATLIVGVLSHMLAKIYKTPVIIFSVAGIIPLVPGGLAYDAMRQFMESSYNPALGSAAKVLMLSGAIAFGLVFSEVVNQVLRKLVP